jgi:cytochrome o ubiquinol oxidase operon protein cyoD
MSAATDHNAADADHAHSDEHGHGSKKSYLIGFALSGILTFIPFWLVMAKPVGSPGLVAILITLFAVAQILVHTVCFLHVNTSGEGGWTLLAYIFTGVLLVITIAGSMWIMFHLNTNMMPGMMTGQVSSTP